MNMKVTNYCNWWSWYSHKRVDIGTEGLGNKRMGGDHTNNSTVEIGKNTEKSPRDLKRFAVTKTSVRNHLLTLVCKTLKGVTVLIIER